MKKKFQIYLVSFLISIVVSNYCYSLSQPKESYQTLKESINALDVTRTKSLRSMSNLNQYQDPSLHQEYSVFVEYLSYRIEKYCTQIYELYGNSLLSELPCSSGKNYSQRLDTTIYATTDEEIQSLDDELLSALGDFDEMLLVEDEKIAQTSRKKTSSETNRNSGQKNSSSRRSKNEMESSNNDEEAEIESSVAQTTKQAAENKNMKRKQKGNKAYKRNKLDKRDDDIVARQLKEAAENENNLELKEKLWEEYYKYKENKAK